MTVDVRYVTNESGERVGVLLDVATYQQLAAVHNDPELLMGLSHDELVALAESALSPAAQNQLTDLLHHNTTGNITTEAIAALEHLLVQVDYLNILKTRARYTLKHLSQVDTLAS